MNEYDEALMLLRDTGPEYGDELANHGPMGADALMHLQRGDAVVPFVVEYKKTLDALPGRVHPISPAEWHETLGDCRRVGDWIDFFNRELSNDRWTAVAALWIPRLLPGSMAGSTHGLIRTAHAARALAASTNDDRLRLQELAQGLAYWAARYQELPGFPIASGRESMSTVLRRLPMLPPERIANLLIREGAEHVGEIEGFAGYVSSLAPPETVDVGISQMTAAMARRIANRPRSGYFAFLHAVTAPAAFRLLLPYISEAERQLGFMCLWQVACAVVAMHGWENDHPLPTQTLPRFDNLIDRAVDIGDEHGIKFVEAVQREYGLVADPTYLIAADVILQRVAE